MTTRCVACSRRSDSGVRRKGKEREKNTPYPTPLFFFFLLTSFWRCLNDLNTWNRLPDVKKVFTPDGVMNINKHKHSITNVSIFCVTSFNAFWKFYGLEIRHEIFLGYNVGPGIFGGFV